MCAYRHVGVFVKGDGKPSKPKNKIKIEGPTCLPGITDVSSSCYIGSKSATFPTPLSAGVLNLKLLICYSKLYAYRLTLFHISEDSDMPVHIVLP